MIGRRNVRKNDQTSGRTIRPRNRRTERQRYNQIGVRYKADAKEEGNKEQRETKNEEIEKKIKENMKQLQN